MAVRTPDLSSQYAGDQSDFNFEDPVQPAAEAKIKQPDTQDEDVAALRNQFGISNPAAAGAHDDSSDVEALKSQFGLGDHAKPKATESNKNPSTSSSTMFHQAGQPAEDQKWGDVLKSAVLNSPASILGTAKATYGAIRHPIDTASAIGDFGSGVMSQIAGALGVKQDPNDKAKNERVANLMEDHFKQVYGSMAGFKHALATDPASIFLDASTLLDGAGLGVRVAGATGDIAKAGEIASKASDMINPVSQSLNLAKKLGSIPVSAVRKAAAGTSGVSEFLQQMTTAVGESPNKAIRDAYKRFNSGKGDPSEYLQKAESAVSQSHSDALSDWTAKHGALPNNQIDFTPIMDHLQKSEAELQKGSPSGWAGAKSAASDVRDLIEDSLTHPDPAKQSFQEVDALKKQIYDLKDKHPNDAAQKYIMGAYHAVRDTLANPAAGGNPEYMNLMEGYQQSLSHIKDARTQLGAGNRSAATNSLIKAVRNSKGASGQNMIQEMSKYEPTLPAMIAGYATNPHYGGFSRGMMDLAMSAGLGLGVHPAAALLPAIGGSPKIIGAANYGAGAALRYPSMIAGKLPDIPVKPSYYAGRIQQESSQASSPSQDKVDPAAPRNVRNQNPTNIKDGKFAAQQPGYAGSDGTFAKFDSNDSGIAAANKLLQIKAAQGMDTPRKLLTHPNHGWAPDASEDYIKSVGKAAGIGPDDHFDLGDPEVRSRVINSIRHGEGDTRAATGGRITRASGGKVSDIEHLVVRLMGLAKKAKKVTDKGTEHLLGVPDEHIVKALDVAQKAI